MDKDIFYTPGFGALPPPFADPATSKVFLLPVPYDSSIEYRTGARSGPRSILEASGELEMFDIELGTQPCEVGIHALPEMQPVMKGPEFMVERIHGVVGELLGRGKMVVTLGGEHSLSAGAIKAYREKYPDLSVLHLDAHADLRNEYLGTSYSHACVMRRVQEICPVVSVGTRSMCLEEHEYIQTQNLKLFYAEEMAEKGAVQKVVSALSPTVYVSIDLDVFDPSIMPAVATPEPGGLLWGDVLGLLRAVTRGKRVVGFDVMELCPPAGPPACAYLAAKLIYKLIGYIGASPSPQRGRRLG